MEIWGCAREATRGVRRPERRQHGPREEVERAPLGGLSLENFPFLGSPTPFGRDSSVLRVMTD